MTKTKAKEILTDHNSWRRDSETEMPTAKVQPKQREIMEKQETVFENALRYTAQPPIKGKITQGKIRWRGIKIVEKRINNLEIHKWLEQRGKQITPTIKIKGYYEQSK